MDIQKVCRQIKTNLKSKGITQDDFALMLKTSSPTLKRWLRGEGLLLKDLIRMLDCLDLKLSEVSLMAEGEVKSKFTYTLHQEKVLASEAGVLAFFDALLKDKSPSQVAKTYSLTERSLSHYLSTLDRIKLIQWLPKNKAKVLVSGEPVWIENGPLSQKFRKQIVEGHLSKYINDPEKLRVGIYSLSKGSLGKLNHLISEVIEKIRLLEIRDLSTQEGKRLSTIIIGFGQDNVAMLSHIPNK